MPGVREVFQGDTMIITVGNTKGGVGKTTLALNIAIARALAGRKVWVVDGDRQGTAQTAISIRSESEVTPQIAVAQYGDGKLLKSQVLLQKGDFDDIVIDAGGRDSTALRAALGISDLVIVPFLPRSFDVWAFADINVVLEETEGFCDRKVYAVLNSADPGQGTDNREAADALEDFPAIQFIDAPIRRRKAFANFAGRGMSVLEADSKTRDDKAVAELKTLLAKLF